MDVFEIEKNTLAYYESGDGCAVEASKLCVKLARAA